MAHKIIIDADPGIGDALAITLALMDPELDVVGITATAGCVTPDAATRNVQALVENLDPLKWPRLGCCETTLSVPLWDDAFSLNGPTGLGEWEFRVADLHSPRESAKLLTDLVRADPNAITLLTLGPLTNLAVACERTPDFLSMLNGLVCLGGSVRVGGDITAAAEFNIMANPEAARQVLLSPATKTLVPLDVSRRPVLSFDQYDRLQLDPDTHVGRVLGQLLPYTLRAYHQHLGQEGMHLHEVTALAAIAQPQYFERKAMAMEIETYGELTRGMTVFDRRGVPQWQTNIDVMIDVDPQGVLDYLQRVLRSDPSQAPL
ncbi:MAG: nucleoside hydrolase [Planctomycetes bacterium]|nr:nucleoside hydrolase [Planctomycetota bacterium]